MIAGSGGKGGATTIDTDHQFSVAMGALMKKNKTTCQAGVEFDADEMDGFRIRHRVCAWTSDKDSFTDVS